MRIANVERIEAAVFMRGSNRIPCPDENAEEIGLLSYFVGQPSPTASRGAYGAALTPLT